MPSQKERAEEFLRLHHQDRPLILPNAWDVPSARIFENAGFPAVATSSAGLMVSRGYPDGQRMPRSELVAAVARIAARIEIPLSVDVVAGFGRGPREVAATVRRILEAGAIGINIEDKDPTTERLFPIPAQVRKIRAIVQLGREVDVPLVVNARTDALRLDGVPEELLREAIRRCIAYRDAGADCVYPMRLTDAAEISTLVSAVECPVNVMIRRGLPPVAELGRLGVKRVSFGPGASYAAMGLLQRISEEILTRGTFASLLEGSITFDELNRLASRRSSDSP
jgi:2-methylisocitrate lyase-like PEP mutase family enzyme